MKIACNVRCLDAKVTGVQRYTKSILKDFPEGTTREICPDSNMSHGIKGHLWEQFILPVKLHSQEILWSPSNTGPLITSNQIVTVHDLVPIDHPEWVTPNFSNWYKFLQPKLFKKVAHIISISEFTKQRIIERFNINENKISVIHNGVEPKFFEQAINSGLDNIPFEKYILILGAIEPRKNIRNILKSWEIIKNNVDINIGLVIAGAKGDNSVFGEYVLEKNLDRVFFSGYVEEKHIVSLYQNALFFVYISLYEGFGLPPLEAMATGCPVLTSNIPAIKEIVQDATILVDPLSIAEICEGMLRYCNDPELRKLNSSKGRLRASDFNWSLTSKKTYNLIMERT